MKPLFPGSYPLKFATALGTAAAIGAGAVFWLDVSSANTGYRGTGMVLHQTETELEQEALANALYREAVYTEEAVPPEDGAPKASEVYENVQVLGDLSADNFNRLMAAITDWVSPEQGCAYCHGNEGNFASDEVYTKVVSRRMLQMTRNINANWPEHVAPTGVTCYTCHRGQPVPAAIWFAAEMPRAGRMVGPDVGQNLPYEHANYASLPREAFEAYLTSYDTNVKVQDDTSRTETFDRTIKAAEYTYSLMIHYSQALGVNCTFCHNSRAFSNWRESTPWRGKALAGQQMVREANIDYLIPLRDVYPPGRLGPTGDAPKMNCLTCHYGQRKPMGGYSVMGDWPELTTEGTPDYSGGGLYAPDAAQSSSAEAAGSDRAEAGGGNSTN